MEIIHHVLPGTSNQFLTLALSSIDDLSSDESLHPGTYAPSDALEGARGKGPREFAQYDFWDELERIKPSAPSGSEQGQAERDHLLRDRTPWKKAWNQWEKKDFSKEGE